MKNIHTKLKSLRKEKKLTQAELANIFGVAKQTISRIENNVIPSDKILEQYSSFFNIPLSELMTLKVQDKVKNFQLKDNILQNKELGAEFITLKSFLKENDVLAVPYFESISAGVEHELVEDFPMTIIEIPVKKGSYSQSNNIISVRINGESMNKVIPNHSIAIIDKGANIKSGDIIAYQLGSDYGIKRIIENDESIKLQPESFYPEFKEKLLLKENIEDIEFSVIGKLIAITSDERTFNN